MTAYAPPTPQRLLLREMPEAERPLYRMTQHGQDALSAAELLALVLGTPDALALAHELLRQHGGLSGLATTSKAKLMRHHGIGAAQASRLLALFTLARRLQSVQAAEKEVVISPADAAAHFIPRLSHLKQEELHVMLLNTRNHLLGIECIYRGSVNTAVIRIGELFRPAIEQNGAAIIVAHNPPTSDPSASQEDVATSRKVAEAGQLLGIELLDSLIIGGNNFVSLKERGLLF